MINFEYIRVNTVDAALDAYKKNAGSVYIAGGTNLVDLMKKRVTSPTRIIDITKLPLNAVLERKAGVEIGALVSNSDLSENLIIKRKFPLLSLALKAGASAQLRNMATVGGNLLQRTRCPYFYDTAMPCNKRSPGSGCSALKGYNRMHAIFGASDTCIAVHPSDMCVALAALDSSVLVKGPSGGRSIPFEEFHRLPGTDATKDNTLRPGELVTDVVINDNYNLNPLQVSYVKIRDRASYAFALVSVAVALGLEGNTIRAARIAMGGVAHKPWRLKAIEKYLIGKEANEQTFAGTAPVLLQGARAYEHNQFKLKLAPAALQEALHKAVKGIQS